MASEVAHEFHRQKMAESRARVGLRIEQGTKGSSPDIRSLRRENPLNFSNPLPDNSSGSKIRPFQCSKDESGRPTPMEIVLANQMKSSLTGGVLKDFRYARKILGQRASDVSNIDLESQGLPPVASPIATLSEADSRTLELNSVLQAIASQINSGRVSDLTLNELRNLPRLLIAVLPSMTPPEAVELMRFIDDDIINELRNANVDAEVRLSDYFENVREFIREVIPLLGLDPASASRGVLSVARDFFGRTLVERDPRRIPQTARTPTLPTISIDRPPAGQPGGPEVPPPRPRRRPRVGGPVMLPDEEQPLTPRRGRVDDRRRVALVGDQLDTMREAFRRNNMDTIRQYLIADLGLDEDSVALTTKQQNAFNTKTTAKNYIKKRTGADIKTGR